MKISKIQIGSFGNMRDRTFQLGPGFNVFYGSNESGKTTMMEFIRSTLVPTRKHTYPERAKTDSGRLTVLSDGGETEIILGSTEGIPKELQGMDAEFYRNIFAMNQKGLDDIDSVSNSDVRSRFLTIPGGENIPQVIESIDGDLKDTLGLTSRSKSRLNSLEEENKSVSNSISELRAGAEEYSALCDESDSLTRELETLNQANEGSEKNNTLHSKVESVRPAYSSLQEMRRQMAELKKFPVASEKDIEEHDRLLANSNQKKAAYDAVEASLAELVEKLPGKSESLARSHRSEINDLLSRRQTRPPVQVAPPAVRKKSFVVPAVMLAMAVAVFVIPGIDMMIKAGMAAILVAAGAAAYIMQGKKEPVPVAAPVRDELEDDVCRMMRLLGLPHISVETDLRKLNDIENTLTSIDPLRLKSSELNIQYMQAKNSYTEFLTRFAGEQGYVAATGRTNNIERLQSSITSLENSIRSSGFDPDQPLPDVKLIDIDRSSQNEINVRLGQLEERKKQVMDTTELDRLIDRSYTVKSEIDKTLKDSITLLFSSIIIQRACDKLYQDVHPGVVETTDRYLSMMTSGKYRLDLDPRRKDLSIISDEGSKNYKQWSTGLRAQVLLSLKLAIAKEMGGGDIPVILDDVLLPFDRERKSGACKALAQVSEEMQVLLFTCDDSVKEICDGMEDAQIIPMNASS